MKTDIVYGAMTLSSFRMKNDSDKIFGENQNPLLFIYLFIRKSCCLLDNVIKCGPCALHAGYLSLLKYTQNIK